MEQITVAGTEKSEEEQQWHEVIKADYYMPVGLTNEFSELFLEEKKAHEYAQKHNLKLLCIGTTRLTTEDYNLRFNN